MKKFLAFLLSLSLLCGSVTALAAETDPPEWAQEAYDFLEENNISPLTTYGAINRQGFLNMLLNVLNAGLSSGTLDKVAPVPEDYFYDRSEFIYWANRMDLAAGCGLTEGTVDPATGLRYGNFYNTLTRAEAAKMLCSTIDFMADLGYEVVPTGESAVYSDASAIPDWAAPFTGRVASYGIMVGDSAQRFNPTDELDWPSSVVMLSRLLTLAQSAVDATFPGVTLHSQMNWRQALNQWNSWAAKPLTGYIMGYYTISNGEGTLSSLVVQPLNILSAEKSEPTITVERYDAQGNVVNTKSIPMELPVFGTFLDGGDYFYIAFGQRNAEQNDSQEVWRIVQYDRDWNRLASVSVNGGDSYTKYPYSSTVSRMTVSEDGKSVALYAARTRYDGHQSNITFLMDTEPFALQEVMGSKFPKNHVSHSFGQFVRYDGDALVTVDHGDAYPRSFVLQKDRKKLDLLKIAGETGQNVTHAIGGGLEVSEDGYLFLGCSTPQEDFEAEDDAPWQVFLTYTDKELKGTDLTWLTDGETSVKAARLVKVDDDTFLVMWGVGEDVHYLTVDGKGQITAGENVLADVSMPTTQPVAFENQVMWIGVASKRTAIYSIEV